MKNENLLQPYIGISPKSSFWAKAKVWTKKHATTIALTLALLIGGLSHGYNMLNYPYYESDEGTYTSQAWAILTQSELAPYTYWYDHPPLGWISIALFAWILPDDLFTFGTSIDTGRVMMLLVHLISVSLIFFITKRITKSNKIAFFVTIFYALSPLAIYFRRRVLLDNLMNMWMLASIAILFVRTVKLRNFALSGLFFAFAFLTKISALFFGPAVLLLVLTLPYKAHPIFRTAAWLSVAVLASFIYPVYSILKGEFLPASVTGGQHVSLIESLMFQMSRGSSVAFYKSGSDFMVVLKDWLLRDTPYVIALGTILIVGIWFAIKNKVARSFVVAALLYILFLIRGKVVINFYILPLITFISLLAGVVIFEIQKRIVLIKNFSNIGKNIAGFLILTTIGYYTFGATTKHLVYDEVSNQRQAIHWIKDNLPEDADIIIDSIMLVELRDGRYRNEKTFENAEWFYKVSRDPAIRDEKYNGNWRTFDYIGVTHEMLKQISKFDNSDISLLAFQNSLPVIKWVENITAFVDEQKFITTNGDWAMVYSINGNTKSQLVDAWKYYRDNFIHSYGQVIDPSNNITTSEGQSYAMLRAVWMNDKEMFDGSWDWTQHHLQHRLSDKLLSWKWGDDKVLDSANATDADEDIALALLFASKSWSDETYSDKAKEIISDIWETSVVEINGTLYLLPMNQSQAQVNEGFLFNPSYLSPAHYRIFATVDPTHDWSKLADDSYVILNRIARSNSTGLPANWYVVNRNTGSLSSAGNYIPQSADLFGYDAFRVFWRVGLDAQWFNTKEARDYLSARGNYLLRQNFERLPNIYNPATGSGTFADQSLAVHAGYLIALSYADRDRAIEYYNDVIAPYYDSVGGYWGSKDNYYDQNWVWFGAALYNDDISNLYPLN